MVLLAIRLYVYQLNRSVGVALRVKLTTDALEAEGNGIEQPRILVQK
jgi:hypothetical protein